jgi:hypothetical protein
VKSDLKLERASRRPADQTGGLIGKEHVRNEAEKQTHDAHVQDQGVEMEEVDDAAAGPRLFAQVEMQQGQQHTEHSHSYADHLGKPPYQGIALSLTPPAGGEA